HKADPQRSKEAGARDDAGKVWPIKFERLQKEPGNGDKHDHQEIEDREAQGQPKTGNDARLAEWDTFHTRYPLLAHGRWRNGAGKLRGNDELRVFACARMRDSKAAIITALGRATINSANRSGRRYRRLRNAPSVHCSNRRISHHRL